ncbi:hypothetical protein [Streptomyces sp. MAR4 CNX-425]|uniref:hypothetical protein n=1 Tax=Streptomyces sp. MAR4 CNX-425 TaxID=3406343 RepID=UPI003B5038F1
MGAFVDAALGFPAVVFSFALLVVVAYWLVAAVTGVVGDAGGADGGAGVDAAADARGTGGLTVLPAALGLGGVPVTVALSLVVAVAWFCALAAGVAVAAAGPPAWLAWTARTAGLALALVAGWYVTRLLARPLRRLLGTGRPAARRDFVGRVCVVRTAGVTTAYGQAEVTAADGSSATVQVRGDDGNGLTAGSRALIFDYDDEGEFFRVAPADGVPDVSGPFSSFG